MRCFLSAVRLVRPLFRSVHVAQYPQSDNRSRTQKRNADGMLRKVTMCGAWDNNEMRFPRLPEVFAFNAASGGNCVTCAPAECGLTQSGQAWGLDRCACPSTLTTAFHIEAVLRVPARTKIDRSFCRSRFLHFRRWRSTHIIDWDCCSALERCLRRFERLSSGDLATYLILVGSGLVGTTLS